MKTQSDYRELATKIELVEIEKKLYLWDENVDRENVEPVKSIARPELTGDVFIDEALDKQYWAAVDAEDARFWDAMFSAANMAVGMRMEEAGLTPAEYGIQY